MKLFRSFFRVCGKFDEFCVEGDVSRPVDAKGVVKEEISIVFGVESVFSEEIVVQVHVVLVVGRGVVFDGESSGLEVKDDEFSRLDKHVVYGPEEGNACFLVKVA